MRSNTGWRRQVRKQFPTAERLREAFNYNQETGEFTWRVRPTTSIRVGDVAGSVSGNYITIMLDGKSMLAHRMAVAYMTGEWPPRSQIIDHRDGPSNAWSNIRSASHGQNGINRRLAKNNVTRVKGVRRRKNGRYQARLHDVTLGMFDTAQEASNAYVAAARKIHGEFAHG